MLCEFLKFEDKYICSRCSRSVNNAKTIAKCKFISEKEPKATYSPEASRLPLDLAASYIGFM